MAAYGHSQSASTRHGCRLLLPQGASSHFLPPRNTLHPQQNTCSHICFHGQFRGENSVNQAVMSERVSLLAERWLSYGLLPPFGLYVSVKCFDLTRKQGYHVHARWMTGPVFSYKLRYIAGFGLVEMVITTNPKPAIYRILYKKKSPAQQWRQRHVSLISPLGFFYADYSSHDIYIILVVLM